MKLVIRPIQDPQRELDVTHRLVSAIAEELWNLYGGNDQLNWIEAERHLQRIVGQVRAGARESEVALVVPSGAAATGTELFGEWIGDPDHAEQMALGRATRRAAQPTRPRQRADALRRLKSVKAGPSRTMGGLARPQSRAPQRDHAAGANT